MTSLTNQIDFDSISKVKDIFMYSTLNEWNKFTGNFTKNKGVSAHELENYINSDKHENTYKYSGIDFDDFQRALPIILNNYNKIEKLTSMYDWHNVCDNLNKCAYLVFLYKLWDYNIRSSKIIEIYNAAKSGNKDAQNILTIETICEWTDWYPILNVSTTSYNSKVHQIFTDIIKKIQYPKELSDMEKAYAQEIINSKINGNFTCSQINTIVCYAYNNKYVGNLSTSEHGYNYFKGSNIYRYEDDICWFNPPKPSGKVINLIGSFHLLNPQ